MHRATDSTGSAANTVFGKASGLSEQLRQLDEQVGRIVARLAQQS